MQIPCERMLWQYWDEDGDFRTAFVRWADELTAGYDRYRASAELDLDLQALRAVLNTSRAAEQYKALRAILKPLNRNGVTMRRLAELGNLDARTVVGACLNPQCSPRALNYMALEEDIVANGIPDGCAGMARKHGLPYASRAPKSLAKRHGVEIQMSKHDPRRRRVAA